MYAQTDLGDRITISFFLEDENSRLVFVGDNSLNVLYIGEISYSQEQLMINDILNDKTIVLNSSPIPPTIDPNCSTYNCTQTKTRLNFQPKPGCSTIVGQACNTMNVPSVTPLFVSYLACKFGVFVGCSLYIDKECVTGVWIPYCPM